MVDCSKLKSIKVGEMEIIEQAIRTMPKHKERCTWFYNALPYPTYVVNTATAGQVYEYEIPEAEKESLLHSMYFFENPPALDDVMFDLHEEKNFTVKDFKIIRAFNRNWLVSPYFVHSGGMMVDWIPCGAREHGISLSPSSGMTLMTMKIR